MKKPVLAVRPYRHSKTHKWILNLRPWGQGRKFFKTKQEADSECLRQKTLLERQGRAAIGLSQRELSGFIGARSKLAEYGADIDAALAFFVDHQERVLRCKTTVAQLAEEVVEAKRKDGRAPKYVRGLRQYLSRLSADFGERLITTITASELDKWLRALPFSPKSRANYRANISVMFSYAEAHGLLASNPVARTERPKIVGKVPGILTVDQARALLEAAQRSEAAIVPMLTIAAFAGLRDSEVHRLDWSGVNLVRGHVEVSAANAKSSRRRLVPIQENLAAWLRPFSGLTGSVVPECWRGPLDRVKKEAGLLTTWPPNALRHSYSSYRLAITNDAPRVALELGHTSPVLLFSNYRELVHPDEARRYWDIKPVTEAGNVVSFAQS